MKSNQKLQDIIAAKDEEIAAKDSLIAELAARQTEADASNAELKARIDELEARLQRYAEQFKLFQSRRFSPSSEKNDAVEQIMLFNEAEQIEGIAETEQAIDVVEAESAVEHERNATPRKKRSPRKEIDLFLFPADEVIEIGADEECHCPACGGVMDFMKFEAHRKLEIVPAQMKVIETRQAVHSCPYCKKASDGETPTPIVRAELPEPLVKGSVATPSAVAYIMTQKYLMHLPLYRQEQEFARLGYPLSRQTMSNWLVACSEDWLQPIYDRLRWHLLQHDVLHADETSLQVLHEPGKEATSLSYMWVYRTSGDTDQHVILFEYQSSRSHLHPRRFLTSFAGYLHADGYAGYHKLQHEIKVIGCWAHLRRKIWDALRVIPEKERAGTVPQEAIDRIAYLFHLEEVWKDFPPEERHELRLAESKPRAEALFAWLTEQYQILPNSVMGKAIRYAHEQKQWLMNVYLDGRLELSNNRIENSIRPFALGRKNWLFSNTPKGANVSSVIYSIIETALANGLKPFEYLEFLLATVPQTQLSALDALLPWGEAVPQSCRMQN